MLIQKLLLISSMKLESKNQNHVSHTMSNTIINIYIKKNMFNSGSSWDILAASLEWHYLLTLDPKFTSKLTIVA